MIPEKDIRREWFSGTGPGGQNRNKVMACCRLTHVPSGITVTAQRHRTRNANYRDALAELETRVKPWLREKAIEVLDLPTRKTSDEVIRTYHHAENRIKDHASGHTESWTDLDDVIDRMIMARKMACQS